MFIAIEGIDGSGKTTIAKALTEKLGAEYSSQKALSTHMGIEDQCYLEYCNAYRKNVNGDPKSMFMLYGLSCYLSGCKTNVVCDRHLPTVHFWYGTEETFQIAEMIYAVSARPDMTFVLSVDRKRAKQRIKKKIDENVISPQTALRDFEKAELADTFVDKVVPFLKHFSLPYEIIDTNEKSADIVICEIMEKINNLRMHSDE